MALLRPFRALRPSTPAAAARVASVPYDVCSTAEARALAAGNADSFLHVTRAEIDLPEGTDVHTDEVYALGARNLRALVERGVLVQEEAPSLYLYRLTWQGRTQLGIVGAYSVEEYDANRIAKHELTRPDKEADRTKHILTLQAQTGPVFLMHRPSPALDALVAEELTRAPLADFVAVDGVAHTLWRVADPQAYVAAFAQLQTLYVADGHHRSAAASNVRRARAEAGTLTPDDRAQAFLAVSFPSDQLRILPYNRLIHDLGGRSPAAFLEELAGVGPLERGTSSDPGSTDAVCVFDGAAWHRLRLTPVKDDPVSRLTPSMLQDRVLGPLLGITDPRRDERISFVGGIRGAGELEQRVRAGEALLAFSMPPVTTEQLIAVADAGEIMPPKSTWFEPKLRSGLCVYPLEDV
ncbi:MAG: DUF1015 domain-containing protein [Planctomycetota bacterium]